MQIIVQQNVGAERLMITGCRMAYFSDMWCLYSRLVVKVGGGGVHGHKQRQDFTNLIVTYSETKP